MLCICEHGCKCRRLPKEYEIGMLFTNVSNLRCSYDIDEFEQTALYYSSPYSKLFSLLFSKISVKYNHENKF